MQFKDALEDGENAAEELSVKATDGSPVSARTLRCSYTQETGATNYLSLNFQFLSGPCEVAFDTSLSGFAPATPFEVAGSRDVQLGFSVFFEGQSYRARPENGQIVVHLE